MSRLCVLLIRFISLSITSVIAYKSDIFVGFRRRPLPAIELVRAKD